MERTQASRDPFLSSCLQSIQAGSTIFVARSDRNVITPMRAVAHANSCPLLIGLIASHRLAKLRPHRHRCELDFVPVEFPQSIGYSGGDFAPRVPAKRHISPVLL